MLWILRPDEPVPGPCAGDNATTGSAIARQCGILPAGARVALPKGQDQLLAALETPLGADEGQETRPDGTRSYPEGASSGASDDPCEELLVVDGPDFRRAVLDADGQLRQAVFDRLWPRLRVLARCSPADKYTIVKGEAHPSPESPAKGAEALP